MTADTAVFIALLVVAGLLAGYLLVALIDPERF